MIQFTAAPGRKGGLDEHLAALESPLGQRRWQVEHALAEGRGWTVARDGPQGGGCSAGVGFGVGFGAMVVRLHSSSAAVAPGARVSWVRRSSAAPGLEDDSGLSRSMFSRNGL